MSIQSEINRIDGEVTSQTSLISQIISALEGKIAGGDIPDGWAAGYKEVIIESETSDVTITFDNIKIDPNNYIFFTWTEMVASVSVASRRISVGIVNFDDLVNSQLFLLTVSSTGGYSAGSQLNTSEITIANVDTNTIATVSYISSRRFKSGNTYKAIILGKKVAS